MRKFVLAGALAALAAPATTPALANHHEAPSAEAALAKALAHERRDGDRARDQYRHPAETLEFFQVEPGMTVADYIPASGWYSRLLIPYLGANGHYVAINPDVSAASERMQNYLGGLAEKFPASAAEWDVDDGAKISAFNLDAMPAELEGQVDRVLVIREFHNQTRMGFLNADMLAFRKMLKPGGMVGMIDHRAKEDAPFSDTYGNKGYVRQSDVIALFDFYGFDLVGMSDVNANPRDPKDWPNGVWMMAPGLAGADTDEEKARRMAIGESDRMTLLFRKRD
jgi:predicted methyltransferase